MALARNLGNKKKFSLKIPKLKKRGIIILVVVAIAVGVYGLVSLSRLTPIDQEKKEIKLETGDRPLPQKIEIWVTADGGLFMRKEPNSKAEILKTIPNGTKLEALETQAEWYKVSYMNQTGWVNKGYVTTKTPAEDPIKNWNTYQNKSFNYSVRYPSEWVAQDYGANPATNSQSYVGFGPQLSPQLNPSVLPPVIIRVTGDSKEKAEKDYKSAQNSTPESVTVSGIAGTKYTFNASSGTQMTAYVVSKGSLTFIIEETGGYSDELTKMIGGLNLS